MAVVLALPIAAFAQEAVLSGTITDTTGGALPGVSVTATHEASGNTFTAVTDQRGEYRISLRIGTYRVAAELSGFNSVNRTGLELLVGSQPSSTCSWRRHRAGVGDGSPRKRRSSITQSKLGATSISGRCRSCRSTAATGSILTHAGASP
jgi:hypothetical protein